MVESGWPSDPRCCSQVPIWRWQRYSQFFHDASFDKHVIGVIGEGGPRPLADTVLEYQRAALIVAIAQSGTTRGFGRFPVAVGRIRGYGPIRMGQFAPRATVIGPQRSSQLSS